MNEGGRRHIRPEHWEGRRVRGSAISRKEQGWSRQSCNRAGGRVWRKLPGWAGRQVADWLRGWPPQEASQGGHRGFTTQEMGPARRAGGGGGKGLGRPTLPRPPPGPVPRSPCVQPCPGRRTSYGLRSWPSPRAGDAPHTCSSLGQVPHPPARDPLVPSLTPHTPTTA